MPTLAPVQIAYHVPDPAQAAHDAALRFGWGPFFLLEHIELESCSHRGAKADFDHSSAYGQAGTLMVEFITQHDDAPSALRDMYAANQTGLHHVACFVPSLEEALADARAAGQQIAMTARTTTGVDFAMVDTISELGHMLEYYEAARMLTSFYRYVREQAQNWDGSEPLRRLKA